METVKRKLGLDVGDVRIGIAVSDLLGLTAQGVETYVRKKQKEDDYKYIGSLVEKYEADTVVIGMPYNMDGSSGKRVLLTEAFAEDLRVFTEAKIEFIDERLTTVQAERAMSEGGVKAKDQKKSVDKLAAIIILQCYLDKINYKRSKEEMDDDKKLEQLEGEEDDLIVFEDENGNEVSFVEVAYFDFEGKSYSALIPAEDEEGDGEEGEPIYFCEVTEDKDGFEELTMVQDEALLDKLFAEFSRLEEMYDDDKEDGCGCGCGGECSDDCDCE